NGPPGSEDGGTGVPPPGSEGRVFVVQGGEGGSPAQVQVREVQVGARADGQVEILSGLEEGDRVVVRGEKPLQPGMQVRPSALSDPSAPGLGGAGNGGDAGVGEWQRREWRQRGARQRGSSG
ncbi:hypothetical protein ACLESD_33470, partial [Pyxidicoccus sp. 3LFB2]